LASHRRLALLHVAVVDADRHQDGAQPREERGGVGGRAQVGLGDDFDEGYSAAVEVHVADPPGVGEPVVQRLAGILLEVEAGQPHAQGAALVLPFERAAGGERPVELRDLVALGRSG
jgi:hypothetical protein